MKDVAPWANPRIHNLGNLGPTGSLHAFLAPAATRAIDALAYGGQDVRKLMVDRFIRPGERVVDLGCGTAMSTAPCAIGVDTSAPMLRVAARRRPDATFVNANAETWCSAEVSPDREVDVATIFFLLHEAPRESRARILQRAMSQSRRVLVVDISPQYQPSAMMLSGEPYLRGYLRDIEDDVSEAARARRWRLFRRQLPTLRGRLGVWLMLPRRRSGDE